MVQSFQDDIDVRCLFLIAYDGFQTEKHSPVDYAWPERFRRFLKTNVKEIGQVRDYVTECLNTPDTQHHRTLQDPNAGTKKCCDFADRMYYGGTPTPRYRMLAGMVRSATS